MSATNRHAWVDGHVEVVAGKWLGYSRRTKTTERFKTRNEAVRWVLDRANTAEIRLRGER